METEELLRRIDGKLDIVTADITSLKVELAKIDAQNIPKLAKEIDETQDRLTKIETKVHTWSGVAATLGFIFGGFIVEYAKRWLS